MINKNTCKFCPHCGRKRDKNKCVCGYSFKDNKLKSIEDPHLFTEPGMKEMNDPYKRLPTDEEMLEIMKNMQPVDPVTGARFMGVNDNLTDEEIKERMKDVHFTA
jgi:hypothetical protein